MKDKVLFNPLVHGIGIIGSFFIGFILDKMNHDGKRHKKILHVEDKLSHHEFGTWYIVS